MSLSNSYTQHANKTPLLTRGQEKELALRWQKEKHRPSLDLLITSNFKMVIQQAYKFSTRANLLGVDDFVSAGNVGLMKAARRYNPDESNGARFYTYALYWIKQCMQRAIKNEDDTVRKPVHLHEKRYKLGRIITLFIHEHNRDPTAVELSEILGISLTKVTKLLNNYKSFSVDDSVPDGMSYMEMVSYSVYQDGEHDDSTDLSDASNRELYLLIQKLAKDLPKRTQVILDMRYGLNGFAPHTLEEAGAKLGLTRERVRQVQAAAIEKLRLRFDKAQ